MSKRKNREGGVSTKIKRDLFRHQGALCQKCASQKNPTAHHIVPVIEGGTDDLMNLSVLCRPCHSEWHHAVENSGDSPEQKYNRYALWLTLPPLWYMMAYAAKNGLDGDLGRISDSFRDFVAIRRAMVVEVPEDLDYYMDALEQFETNTGAHCIKIGIKLSQAKGIKSGRKPMPEDRVQAIRKSLEQGLGIRETARLHKASPMTVTSIKRGTYGDAWIPQIKNDGKL